MYDVGEGLNYGYASEGDAEQEDVQQAEVGEPDAPAVHPLRVGVHLAVSRAHIHDANTTVTTLLIRLRNRTEGCVI